MSMQPGALVAVLTVSATITPGAHDFGSQTAGTTGAVYAFTITNPGGTTTGMLAAQLDGLDPTQFQIASNACTTLAPSMSCTISLWPFETLGTAS